MNTPDDNPATVENRPDHVKSFVKRKGHFSDSRRAALENLWPIYGLDYNANQALNFSQIFNNSHEVILEIGFGMGITTAEIAQNNPGLNYLGVEVYAAGVGSLMKLIGDAELKNLRAIQHDVFDVIRDMIPKESLRGVHIFFPDPWPKLRHHKRRLIQTEFLSLLQPAIKPGGYIHCATDWQPYADHMLEVFSAHPGYANTSDQASGFSLRPEHRPLTKFEVRGIKLGHGVWDLIFNKN
jgi:tRNA (guanine-N7-)-methyltransferase